MRVEMIMLLVALVSSNETDTLNKTFIPTTEWKEISEGNKVTKRGMKNV